jgi:hypothetical protein
MAANKSMRKANGISRTTVSVKRAGTSEASAKGGTNAKSVTTESASRRIDERIRSLNDWRADTLSEVRRWIHEADPDIMEECKWVKPTNPWGVPVWSHAGIVCTGETYKEAVKLTFARGASLKDPHRLFNSSLEGNARRAIDIREGEAVNAEAFKDLIRAAVAENLRTGKPKSKSPPNVRPRRSG